MPGAIEQRLSELGIVLPTPSTPAANYAAVKVVDKFVYISGQLPRWNDELKYTGKLGDTVSVEEGYQAARLCALNLITHMSHVTGGNLERVSGIARLNGYVACTADFTDHATVLNGGSDLIKEVFGDTVGDHTRLAIGCNVLPFDATVEFDGVFVVA